MLFGFPCFFLPFTEVLFCSAFPFYPRDFGGSARIKIRFCFFVIFLAFFKTKQGKEDQGECTEIAISDVNTPLSNRWRCIFRSAPRFVIFLSSCHFLELIRIGFGKRGLLEKGSSQKSPFSRESREFRDSREPPDCGKQGRIRPFFRDSRDFRDSTDSRDCCSEKTPFVMTPFSGPDRI